MRKRELESFRTELNGRLEALVGLTEEVKSELAEERLLHADPNDRASHETERSFTLRLRDRERRLVQKIEAALRRIEDGTFGVCDECGEEIGRARLKARPMTTLCIACKEEAERAER